MAPWKKKKKNHGCCFKDLGKKEKKRHANAFCIFISIHSINPIPRQARQKGAEQKTVQGQKEGGLPRTFFPSFLCRGRAEKKKEESHEDETQKKNVRAFLDPAICFPWRRKREKGRTVRWKRTEKKRDIGSVAMDRVGIVRIKKKDGRDDATAKKTKRRRAIVALWRAGPPGEEGKGSG